MTQRSLLSLVLAFAAASMVYAGGCGGCGSHAAKADSAGSASADAAVAPAEYSTIDTDGLKATLDNGDDVVILDARAGKWDDGRRIPGAKQLSSKASADAVAAVVPDKDAKIIAYCTSTKCPASAYLANHLKKLGYSNVTKYPDGIEGWVAAGHPVENASN